MLLPANWNETRSGNVCPLSDEREGEGREVDRAYRSKKTYGGCRQSVVNNPQRREEVGPWHRACTFLGTMWSHNTAKWVDAITCISLQFNWKDKISWCIQLFGWICNLKKTERDNLPSFEKGNIENWGIWVYKLQEKGFENQPFFEGFFCFRYLWQKHRNDPLLVKSMDIYCNKAGVKQQYIVIRHFSLSIHHPLPMLPTFLALPGNSSWINREVNNRRKQKMKPAMATKGHVKICP